MSDYVTTYGELASFLRSIVTILVALVGLYLFWRNKRSKLTEDNHRVIIEKRSFEINYHMGLLI